MMFWKSTLRRVWATTPNIQRNSIETLISLMLEGPDRQRLLLSKELSTDSK